MLECFEKRTTLCDAMSVCWKIITVEERNKVMGIIREACRVAPPNEKVWTKENVLCLVKFFNLDDVFKIICYFLTATIDPSFIFRAEEESSNSTEANIDSTQMDVFCTWKPSHLSTKYVNHSCNKKVQKEIFQHITNCVSKQNWEKCDITTSDYLDA